MTNYPPFPTDGTVAVQDLLVVDYKLLKEGDQEQANILWEAATKWGFCLKNQEAESFVEPMFKMGQETLSLPFEEKMKYWQGNKGASFGYRAAGATYVDVDGSTDASEFINISKDDAMAYPRVVHKVYPETVNAYMKDTVRPFIETCINESRVIMKVFNEKLGLPEGTLLDLHDHTKPCISETRCIKVPAAPKDTKIALGQHTDFGSLSFLANRLGGLQVLISDNEGEQWKYVKPIEGHFICNIGDTLSILSGGILKSCTHRVLPPPGPQAGHERWSLVYFLRPTNDVYLEALVSRSSLIAEAVRNAPDKANAFPEMTAAQWFVKKQSQHRTDKDKGVESLLASGPKNFEGSTY
uniref:Fe2OG dioxygenase domain-containing protein n=1 Tax=Psilocybe cubensis TaxID=181762 RepID=A0A8H7XU77_PSICU